MSVQTIVDVSALLARLHAALDREELASACGGLVESLAGDVFWEVRIVRSPRGEEDLYFSGHGASICADRRGAVRGGAAVDLRFGPDRIGELLIEKRGKLDARGEEILKSHVGIAITKLQLWKQEETECAQRRLGSEMLGDISAIVGSFDRDFVLARLLEQALRVVGSDVGSVLLREGAAFQHPVILGLPREVTDHIAVDGRPVADVVADAGEPLILEDPDMSAVPTEMGAVDLRRLLALPLVNRGRVFGVLMAANPTDVRHGSPYMEIAERLCHLAAIGVENAVLHRRAMERERVVAMGQVMAGLSHDIRNMLHGMQAGMYLLESGVEKCDIRRAAEAYPILGSAMERLSGLVLDMLDFSMNRPPRREPVDVNELIGEIITANSRLAEARRIELGADLDPAMERVPLDSTGLFRCLSNLVTNAMETIDEEGRIELVTEWDPSEAGVTIRVRDDGPGIHGEDLPRLFDALFTTKGSKGTGLGLAVTKKIVEEHRGSVEARSGPDGGAEFILRLPKEIGRPVDQSIAGDVT